MSFSGLYCTELLRRQTQWTLALTIKGMCQTNECKNFSFNFKEYIEMKKTYTSKNARYYKKKKSLIRVKCAKNNETPSPSKPYQVLELLPVLRRDNWRWQTRSLPPLLPRQQQLRPISSRTSRQWPPIPPGRFCELMLAGLTPKKSQRNRPPAEWLTDWPLKHNSYTSIQKEEKTQEAFFAVSALWIEGNLSGLPLCDTKTSPTSTPLSSFLSSLSHPPSCSPPLSLSSPRHAATDLCFRERYSVNPCWLKDSFVRC